MKFEYHVKIKSIKEPFVLDMIRGEQFKKRYDDPQLDRNNRCQIGEDWSGTWHDISNVNRIMIKEERKPLPQKEDNSPKMTFGEFAKKHPDKVAIWEEKLNKEWDGKQFVIRKI